MLAVLLGLFSAGGMGLWHGVEYYETEKLSGSEYFKDWPQVINYDKTTPTQKNCHQSIHHKIFNHKNPSQNQMNHNLN